MADTKKVYIVIVEDCNENDCGCSIESIDSVWFDKEKAIDVAKGKYPRCHAHVDEFIIE